MENRISQEDYQQRIKTLQAKLIENDLDAYIVHANAGNYENVRYLTNHWPLFEVAGVIVPCQGNALLLIGAEAPEFAAESSLGPDQVRIVADYGHSIGLKWKAKYFTWQEIFDEVSNGKGIKRLGMGDYATTPVQLYQNLQAALLPGGELIRAEAILEGMRMCKSEAERALIREACRIDELVFEDLLNSLRPEMTEYQCEGIIIDSICRHGGEGPAFPVLSYAGERTRNMIARSTHTPIGRNRLLSIDFGALYGGYSSAYSRALIFGKMPERMKREIEFTIDVHSRIMDEWAKPGRVMGDIYRQYCDYFESHGYGFPPAGASHGIGVFECEPPAFRLDVPNVVEENMVFACDTFFRSDDYGFRFEDCYCIGRDKNEKFSSSHLCPIEL